MEAYKKYGTAKFLHDALPNAIYIDLLEPSRN